MLWKKGRIEENKREENIERVKRRHIKKKERKKAILCDVMNE